ncbi:MAG: patatin-like phospholipase family protein [Candidatus Heimdallarchaeaceae archaeon]
MVRVSKEDVKFLVFEGGGGKGVAYIGALEVMKELGILSYYDKEKDNKTYTRLNSDKIKGVAGTSVGSIIALLLACGYTPEEMKEMLMMKVGINILDTLEFGKLPTIYTKEYQDTVIQDPRFKDVKKFMKASWIEYLKSDDKKLSDLLEIPTKRFQRGGLQFLSLILKGFLSYETKKSLSKSSQGDNSLFDVKEIVRSETVNPALKKILNEPIHSFNSLKYEYGLFLGKTARDMFDLWIEQKSGIKNCTFKVFSKEFNIDLVVTAVSANSKEVFYFRNNRKWKDLCVADAIRMSINIPFLFKPVLMKKTKKGINSVTNEIHLANFMIDGGAINNLPIHVFNKKTSSKLNPSVIGLTLVPYKKAKKTEVNSLSQYIADISYILLNNATNLQIQRQEDREQIIELDTKDVSIFDFVFKEIPEDVIKESRARTLEYFS